MKSNLKTAAALALLLPSAASFAATRYVTPQGTGDGSSWAAATSDLQAAINASESGDMVWVAAGTYQPTELIKSSKKTSKSFMLKDGVSLYGGFAGTETSLDEREVGANAFDMKNATILDADDAVADEWVRVIADATTYRWEWQLTSNQVTGTKGNSSHLLYSASALTQPTVIDGFTLKGANANVYNAKASGGAVYAPGTVDIRNCRFIENSAYFTAEATDSNSYGGAAYLSGGSMKNCYFSRTYCHSSYGNGIGGAVYAQNSNISDCVFEDCVGLDGGGAVYLRGGSLDNCTFSRCYSSQGGAVYNNGGSVSRIVIEDCRALSGGGVFNNGSLKDAKIYGCYADATEYSEGGNIYGGAVYNYAGDISGILAYNNTSWDGGGIYLRSGRLINATVQNNTVRNAAGGANVAGSVADAVLNSITAPDVKASNFIAPTSFAGHATDDSQLPLLAAADWRLAPGSEFIDAGTAVDGFADGTDLAGNPRVSGSSIDFGAYESQKNEKVPAMVLTFAPGTESARLGVGGADGYEFSIDWGDGSEVTYSTQAYHTGTLKGSTVKIYGEDLVLLYANSQNIVSADLSHAAKLQRIQLQLNGLTSLVLGSHPRLDGIYAAGNKLTSLDVSGCPAIRVLDVHENAIEGAIDCSAMAAASKIDVADNRISSLKLPKTSTLYEVDCSRNLLAELDATGLTGLDELACSENALTELDLTGLSAMTSLYAYGNKLAAIDIAPCSSLETLNVSENQITEIDLSVVSGLSGVYLQDNKLTALDVTANPSVRWLNVSNNQISALDVHAQPYLSILLAPNNRISAIDLSNNSSLSSLDLAGNGLTSLDVSAASYLSQFHMENNAIESIDLSKNRYLYGFFCGNNRLTELDLSNNTYLQRLEAQGNALTALDLKANTGLQEILLQSNKLTADALSTIVSALPDVSSVEVTPETEAFVRQFNVSYNPGTAETDFAPAAEKGWFVTAEADTEEAVTLDALNLLINRSGDNFIGSWNAEISFANEAKTGFAVADFMGTGSRLAGTIDADGNISIYPQVCGFDASYNLLMIVPAEETGASNPLEIQMPIGGHFDGKTFTLNPWNIIIVPGSFSEILGTYFPQDVTSEFVVANGSMTYDVNGTACTQNIYAEIAENQDVIVYGWAQNAKATLHKDQGKWIVDSESTAFDDLGTEYVILSGENSELAATAQPDARTLEFGAWKLCGPTGSSVMASANSATLNFGFDLPKGTSAITEIDSAVQVVSTVYYNAAGISSTEPFDGFNIKVETLSDGTKRTVKISHIR